MIRWQKRRLAPSLQVVLHITQAPPARAQLQYYSPFSGHPWRSVKGTIHSWQNSGKFAWQHILHGRKKKMARCTSIYWFTGYHQRFGWWQKYLGKRHADRPLHMGKGQKDICIPCKHQKVPSEEDSNNHVDRMTCPKWLRNRITMASGKGVIHGFSFSTADLVTTTCWMPSLSAADTDAEIPISHQSLG